MWTARLHVPRGEKFQWSTSYGSAIRDQCSVLTRKAFTRKGVHQEIYQRPDASGQLLAGGIDELYLRAGCVLAGQDRTSPPLATACRAKISGAWAMPIPAIAASTNASPLVKVATALRYHRNFSSGSHVDHRSVTARGWQEGDQSMREKVIRELWVAIPRKAVWTSVGSLPEISERLRYKICV